MFIRKKKNISGSTSVQIISKANKKYKVIETIGSGKTNEEIELLVQKAYHRKSEIEGTISLFPDKNDSYIESYLAQISNSQVQVIGPELIFGRIFDHIGYNKLEPQLFRHLVITRLYHPGSKLKAIDYLYRFLGISIKIDVIYRFLDDLVNIKEQIEMITYNHTKMLLCGEINIVFYDMTTLHFESSDEDDLRRTGFSKVGKHQNPQIYLGLLVTLQGLLIGYDIYEGNIYEGHTLVPFIKRIESRFDLSKPIVIADAGLLTKNNIRSLQNSGYQYILGGKIKNEPDEIKTQILAYNWDNGKSIDILKSKDCRIIVSYSESRAKKDKSNRVKGLQRLEKRLKSGKLTKANINNRGYNKYLKLTGQIDIEIDYTKYEFDSKWDGLKGYITNTKLPPNEIIENYRQLWRIERAFRISKTDLKIRPIYHRLKHRIDGHICISFVAYAIYMELERVLKLENSAISVKRAVELTHNMYQLNIVLPDSKRHKSILLEMNNEQNELFKIIEKYF